MYDLLVVGSGLYGAVVAQQAKERGQSVLVIERRNKVGGNIRDEWCDGICVHQYGAHIFHTGNKDVWQYARRFAHFVPYRHVVLSRNDNRLYHLPFSMTTMNEVFGITRIDEFEEVLRLEHEKESYLHPENLEQQAVNLVGRTIYELLIKGYTEKQWGMKATDLPAYIIRRLPFRFSWNTDYFDDCYQGIPEEGYSNMIRKMLSGIDVKTGVDFCHERDYWLKQAQCVVYTGMADELMDYSLGVLGYRSLRFETKRVETVNRISAKTMKLYQPCAVVNEASADIPYTRTIEHQHFPHKQKCIRDFGGHIETFPLTTIITREFPALWKPGDEAYYPVNNDFNNLLYRDYCKLIAHSFPSIVLGGRLGLYRYMDMDDTIEAALAFFKDRP